MNTIKIKASQNYWLLIKTVAKKSSDNLRLKRVGLGESPRQSLRESAFCC
ncbi:MAG: hypothetical protein IJA97_02235 [Clostridia bacterium]|nr:hypothetical protein [Clostridia bacterium]